MKHITPKQIKDMLMIVEWWNEKYNIPSRISKHIILINNDIVKKSKDGWTEYGQKLKSLLDYLNINTNTTVEEFKKRFNIK